MNPALSVRGVPAGAFQERCRQRPGDLTPRTATISLSGTYRLHTKGC